MRLVGSGPRRSIFTAVPGTRVQRGTASAVLDRESGPGPLGTAPVQPLVPASIEAGPGPACTEKVREGGRK